MTEKNVNTHVMLGRGDSYFGQSWNDDSECPSSVEVKQINQPNQHDSTALPMNFVYIYIVSSLVFLCLSRSLSLCFSFFDSISFESSPVHFHTHQFNVIVAVSFFYFIRRFESLLSFDGVLLLSFPILLVEPLCSVATTTTSSSSSSS